MDLKWKKAEKRIAKDFGGKRVRGSGNKWWNPGDISVLELGKLGSTLIENKQTDQKTYSLSLKVLTKI